MSGFRLADLPMKPDPEWFGFPGRNRGERLAHGYASGASGAPSICGKTTRGSLVFPDRIPRRVCQRCVDLWSKQYPAPSA